MIEVKYENGKFLAKGTFSVGIAGVYENKDFDGEDSAAIAKGLEDYYNHKEERIRINMNVIRKGKLS